MSRTDEIKKNLRFKKPQLQLRKADMLSTGSTLLNLACTGNPEGGFGKGEYVFFVGDSMSGKTWFTLSCLAEASRRKSFRNYQFIYDAPEQGAKMDLEFFFGAKVAKRIDTPPSGGPSRTVEEFYFNMDAAIDEGPCIYIMDSMDALGSDEDVEQFEKQRKAYEEDKDAGGSYGMGKAKSNSTMLRQVLSKVQESKSILIIISQTRDNIGFGSQFNPKTRSGGKSLRFYADIEIWTSVRATVKKKYKGKDRQQGVITKCEMKKNRHNGQLHKVEVPIYHSYGIDDVASCIGYLVEEKHWSANKGVINATDFEFKGKEGKLIEHIEENDLEPVLREIVGEVWQEIQDATAVKGRKKRYE